MNKDDRKIRFGLWYDFRNPPNGGRHRIAFTARFSIRSRGAKTMDSTTFGCPSTISSKMAISPRFYR